MSGRRVGYGAVLALSVALGALGFYAMLTGHQYAGAVGFLTGFIGAALSLLELSK